MPALRLPRWLCAAPLLALAHCGGGPEDKFAPVCPGAAIVRDAADLSRYRSNGRDLTDTVLEGRITGLGGRCVRDGADTVVATIQVGIDLNRGPAATGRAAEIAYFVAVLEGDRILDKQVYQLRAEFPPNSDRLRLTGEEVELRLPVQGNKTAVAYRIQVGFQLTPAELEFNRQRGRR